MFFIATTQIDLPQYSYKNETTLNTEEDSIFNKFFFNKNYNDVMVIYNDENIDFNLDDKELNETINFISSDSFSDIWNNEENEYWENY